MFKNLFPVFGKGRILKKEMLENLRDYPRNYLDIYYKNYSDGIISGTELVISENLITINEGIIKFNGKLYMLSDKLSIPYTYTNKEVLIKIRFLDETSDQDYKFSETRVYIDENPISEDSELELGRFKLREGAILRSKYQDFQDFSTEFNTINIISTNYAGIGKPTLNPLILKYFSHIVFKNSSENSYDIGFAMQCINQEIINRDLILYYISNRLGIGYKEYTNLEIYKHLTSIIRELESGIKRNTDVKQKRNTVIIVD